MRMLTIANAKRFLEAEGQCGLGIAFEDIFQPQGSISDRRTGSREVQLLGKLVPLPSMKQVSLIQFRCAARCHERRHLSLHEVS